MSLYVLDTDVLSLLQNGNPAIDSRVRAGQQAKDILATTVISVEEQLTGWYARLRDPRSANSPKRLADLYQRLANTVKALAEAEVLSFTETAIIRYGQLLGMKLNVRKNDLRIAAITLEHGGILVSRNLRDFQRVPGLIVEDWSA